MAYTIKREDLEYLLEQIFGMDWKNTYKLDHDMLGYAIYIKEDNGVRLFSSESRRLTIKEMYYYLRGLFDMTNFYKKQNH